MRKIFLFSLLLVCPWVILSQIQLENTLLTERTVASNLDVPWDMTYSNDGWIWFTELSGNIKRVHPDTNVLETISTVPDVEVFGFSAGMHSIVLHPDFPSTPYLFVHYTNTTTTSKLVRYTYGIDSNTLSSPLTIIDNIPGSVSHNGSRMLIHNNKLFISIGDGYTNPNTAQNTSTLNGNILRLNLDGTVPSDNPIADSYVWSFGHRNPQGLCIGNDKIYSSEHGTSTDDEINIIESNRNYGWPNVQGFCNTASEMTFCTNENVKEPIWTWTPAIAPCGMDYFNHPSVPEWENSLLLAVLKDKQLIQLKLNEDGTEITEENLYLTNVHGRLRDVLVIPDGRIFVCTTNKDFAGTPSAEDDKIIELKNNNFLTVEDINFNDISIFPNPAKHYITVNTRNPIQKLQLFDILGKQIQVLHNDNQLQIKDVKPGVYLLKVSSNNESILKRIIIE